MPGLHGRDAQQGRRARPGSLDADVLASTWFEGSYRWARQFSKGYAGFDKTEGELKDMWDRKLKNRAKGVGWPSCKAFENESCKSCASCLHKGRIKSRLELSARRQQLSSPQLAPSEGPLFVDPYSEFAGPVFPVDLLPPTLASFVNAEHRAMGADPAAIAMAALTAVAGAINAETSVRVGDSWFEKPILWTFLIGNPSTLKFPIVDKTVRPLRDIDKHRTEYWRQRYGSWKRQAKANPKSSIPPPAKPARCITSDITPEKTAEILSRASSGSLMVHDELASWMDGFERYTAGGASRGFYLQCWKGGPHNQDRVGQRQE